MFKFFSKNKKGVSESDFGTAEITPNVFRYEHKTNYFHKKAICEDGKLYNTETATEVVKFNEGKASWDGWGHCTRTYFITAKGKWFSCWTLIQSRKWEIVKKVGDIDVKVEETDVTYMDLKLESAEKIKQILGATNIDLYKKYFGEVEEG